MKEEGRANQKGTKGEKKGPATLAAPVHSPWYDRRRGTHPVIPRYTIICYSCVSIGRGSMHHLHASCVLYSNAYGDSITAFAKKGKKQNIINRD